MKNPSAVNTLRTELIIAKFGLRARHRVCQAALRLRGLDSKIAEQAKEGEETLRILKRIPPQHRQTQALIKVFHAEGRSDLENEARHTAVQIHELLIKTEAAFHARTWILDFYKEHRQAASARFEQERAFATKDAIRALQRLPKGPFQSLQGSAHIKAAILTYLGNKIVRAAKYTHGAPLSYTEAALGDTRLMTDPVFQGCLLASELPARNIREARRICKGLGLRLAKEPKKEKRPIGRPQTTVELVFTRNTDFLQKMMEREQRGKNRSYQESASVKPVKERKREIDYVYEAAKGLRADILELKKLTAEGQVKGRSPAFAAFLDWGKRPAIPNPLLKRGVSATYEGTAT